MMEFEDEHDEEQEEEEEDEDEITIPPPAPPLAPPPIIVPPSYDSVTNSGSTNMHISRSRVSSERRSSVVRYRECLKNHAVSIGGHAVDGCGEFMPAGEDGTLDALKCAACNCHRNFHRKETDMSSAETFPSPGGGGAAVATAVTPAVATAAALVGGVTPSPTGALYPQFSAYYRTPAPPAGYMSYHQHHQQHHYRPLTALPSTSGATHSGDMGDDMSHPSSSGGEGRRESGSGGGGGGSGSAMMIVPKKRFRTKFTQDQKDKMLAFAEKLGWRIQKPDEAAVQQFCAENQIKRQILKVWMHNNKHTLGKKP